MSTLPAIRKGYTHRLVACGFDIYITLNFYEDTKDVAEVFLVVGKNGSVIGGLMDVWAITLSKAFQAGVKWDQIREQYLHQRFEPTDETYSSMADAVARGIDFIIQHHESVWGDKADGQVSGQ